MPRVNPEILRWARETAGLSPAEAVRKLSLREARGVAPTDRLAALESGEVEPTRPMLVKMAKQYRRPLLTFYFETFRGLTLADDVAPFIAINDQDSRAAWCFTLLHELAHLWLGQTGVSGERAEQDVERFCNEVAGEFLLPRAELAELELDPRATATDLEPLIQRFASARNVSRSMVAYKLHREGLISRQLWQRLSSGFREQWLAARRLRRERNREKPGGPSYYTVRRHRLGASLVALVSRLVAAGELTTSKASHVLGVKPSQVQPLVDSGAMEVGPRSLSDRLCPGGP